MTEMDHPIGDEARPAAPGDRAMAAGFVAELRRRGVLRAVLAYAVVAFAVLQVVEPVLHGLRLPDWVLTAVVIALGAGFPVTIVVSWAFDLTLRGFERATSTTADLPHASRWRLVAMTLGGVVLGAVGSWFVLRNEGRAAAGPDGRVVVAVADFANETHDPELDGLSEILVGWLEQSRSLRVLTRARLVDLLLEIGREKTDRIDEQLAREVGRRAGVRVLLLASIRQIGGNYAVELRAVDPEKDDYLFAVPERAKAKSDLFPLIERLSDRVRERIRERPAEVEAAKIKVDPLTRSFEAWEHYFRGIREEEAFHFPEALREYREAVRADPQFALAHYRIAYRGEFLRLPASDRDLAMRSALANVHSLPVKERMLVHAWKAHIDGRDDDAQAIYRRAIDAFADDKDVLFLAGDLYFHAQRWEDALPLLRRVSALAPRWDLARDHLSACLSTLGLFDELQQVARSWVEKMPTPVAFANLSDALGQAGRVEESIAAGRRATEMDDRLFSRAAWGSALVLAERYEEAEAVFRPLFDAGRADNPGVEGRILLSSALRYQGRHQEALTVIESLPPDSDGKYAMREVQRLNLFFCVACRPPAGEIDRFVRVLSASTDPVRIWGPNYLAFYGNLDDAERWAARLPMKSGPWRDALPHYQVNLAWRRGDKQRAISEATGLWRQGSYWSRPAALYFLTVFAHEDGRDADLLDLVDTLARTPSNSWRSAAYPETIYWAVLAHERLGESDKARMRIEKLLRMWKRADPDLPLLAEAKSLCRRLACRAD